MWVYHLEMLLNESPANKQPTPQPDEEAKPTIYDTLLFQLPRFFYNQSVGRVLGKKELVEEPLFESSDLPEEEAAIQSATAQNLNGEARKRKAKAKNVR